MLSKLHALYASPVQLTHNEEPVQVPVEKSATPSTKEAPFEVIDLVKYLTPRCPSLFDPSHTFIPTPYLFSGHLQTFFASRTSWDDRYKIPYDRQLLHPTDGGTISLDWTTCPGSNLPDTTPCLVVLHGLTGGSHEAYVRALLDVITREMGYRAVVVNFRGCANTPVTSPQLYNGGYTGDFRFALRAIQGRIPNAPLGAVGFSLGSNLLVKYLGEAGADAPFRFAMSVGNPFDMHVGSLALNRGFLGRNIYNSTMAGMLKRLFLKHQDALRRIPGIDIDAIHASTSVREFDTQCTRVAFGYDTVDDYYRDASSAQYVTRVRVPLLCLNSLDDPISASEAIPYDECRANPYVLLATTPRGGHIGWFQGITHVERWCTMPLSEYADAMFKTLDDAHPAVPLNLTTTSGGHPKAVSNSD